MTTSCIVISRQAARGLVDLWNAALTPETEVCCLLSGECDFDGLVSVSGIAPLDNMSDEEHSFMVTLTDVRRAVAMIRESGDQLVGFCHSHPAGPLTPTGHDHELPELLEVPSLIYRVQRGMVVARGWERRRVGSIPVPNEIPVRLPSFL